MPYLLLIVMVLVGGLAADKARASELEVAPVLLALEAAQSSATIEIRNRGPSPVTLQVRPFRWSQTQTDDVLTPTSDLVLSPPIFTVPSGSAQTVRLMLRGDARAGTGAERSYRLLFDELPSSPSREGQVTVVLQMSVPVFVPAAGAEPALAWTAARSPDGTIVLTATNMGGAWVRVMELEATSGDGRRAEIAARSRSPYVLAGAQRQWIVQGPAAGDDPRLRLRVRTPAGVTEVVLTP